MELVLPFVFVQMWAVAQRAARRRGMTLTEWLDWYRLVDEARD